MTIDDPNRPDPNRPDPNRPDPGRPETDDTVVIGSGISSGLGPVEDRVRRSLRAEADSLVPTDRLGAILSDAHAALPPSSRSHRRWLVPLAAAAAVALVAAGVWATMRPGSTPPVAATASATTPATSAASTGATSPTSGTSSTPSSVPTQTATQTSAPPAVQTVSLPVYYVGHLVPGTSDLRLFREFVPTRVSAPADAEGRALAALTLAMGPAPTSSTYVEVWQGVRPLSVSLADPARIAVTLSGSLGDSTGVQPDLAVQQLVWTAQAAVGKGALPVVLTVDGGADVAPGVPSGSTRNRPTDAMGVYAVLSPLWIDEPFRGEAFRAGASVTVKGVASTFEANVEWQVLRAGTVVAQGATTASIGAPERGAYSFRTGHLAAGEYIVRVLETSAKDGSLAAEQRMPFTVR